MNNLESTSRSFNLPGIKKGMYMCWNIVTQCWNDVRVVIKDECKIYVDETKPFTTSGNLTKLSMGDAFVQGDNLTIEFSSTKSNSFDRSVSNGDITDAENNVIGHVTDICIEDNGGSIDFNDVYANIVAWNKQG